MRFVDSLGETAMAKATKKPWTNEDVRLLKTLARGKTKTSVLARKLKRTEGATRQKASVLGVKLAGALPRKRKPWPTRPAPTWPILWEAFLTIFPRKASTLEKEVESAAAAMDVVRLREIRDRPDEIVKECSVALADAMSTIERRAEAAKAGNEGRS
jgi:hypothetical protein